MPSVKFGGLFGPVFTNYITRVALRLTVQRKDIYYICSEGSVAYLPVGGLLVTCVKRCIGFK